MHICPYIVDLKGKVSAGEKTLEGCGVEELNGDRFGGSQDKCRGEVGGGHSKTRLSCGRN